MDMPFATIGVILLAALALDAAIGDPPWLYGRPGHPVRWLGALIGILDRRWNDPRCTDRTRRWRGAAAMVVAVGGAAALAALIQTLLWRILPWPLAVAVIVLAVASLLAQRSLWDHVAAVATALEVDGLAGGRTAVARIVGRDPESLDDAAVARAAIESLAENFSDGVVAPAVWTLVLGLPGCVGYKAANTADSMIGHRTARHQAFGWAAARFDDLVNLPAARLAALWLILAAAATPGARWRAALAAVIRDARHHRSPNAGWPEAAVAGALGLRLGGPRHYHGAPVDDHWMGDGRAQATVADIRAALALYRTACLIQAIAVGGIVAAALAVGR